MVVTRRMSRQDPAAVLGRDVIHVVLGNLPAKDLAVAGCVSKQWQSLCSEGFLWRRVCQVGGFPANGAAADHTRILRCWQAWQGGEQRDMACSGIQFFRLPARRKADIETSVHLLLMC